MDEEAQERIAEYLVKSNLPDYGKDAKWKAYQVLRTMRECGYRKLPEDKPLLLGDEERKRYEYYCFTRWEWNIDGLLQAQREADIKHYEK